MHTLLYLVILISSTSAYDWTYSYQEAQYMVISQNCDDRYSFFTQSSLPFLLTITPSGFSYVDSTGNTNTFSTWDLYRAVPPQSSITATRDGSNANITISLGNFTQVKWKYNLMDLQMNMKLGDGSKSCSYTLSMLNGFIVRLSIPLLISIVACLAL